MWQPGRWTPLFFWDEAVALAAGHRPCALCRHGDYVRWLDAWEAAFGDRPRADPLDRVIHEARVEDRRQRRHTRAWRELPPGTFVQLGDPEVAAVVLDDRLVPWSASGYGPARDRPDRGQATVLTPAPTVDVLAHGYRPVLHPTAA